MKHLSPNNFHSHPPLKSNSTNHHSYSTGGFRFFRSISFTTIYLTALFYGIGCSEMSDFLQENKATKIITGATERERRQNILVSDRLQLRAREYEKNGEWQSALLCWQVLSFLNPSDQEYAEKFNLLQYETRLLGDRHFAKGVVFFKKKSYKSARQEFLNVLRYNPDHPETAAYLKDKMTFKVTSRYRIQKGDSLVNIAKNVYQDANKYYLIAVYNNLDVNQKLIAGKYLNLPSLEPGLTMPLVDISRELKNADQLFLNQQYESVLQSAGKILKIDSSNREAAELKNAALYQIAERFRQQRQYLESLETLKKLDPRYKGVQKDIAEVKTLLKKQAEENYRTGVNYFVNEQFRKAIESWEKTLLQNPQHPKARPDIEKARNLLKKLEEID